MNVHVPFSDIVDSVMTLDGGVTIPESVRKRVGLIAGDPVRIAINDRGEAVLLPGPPRPVETREERAVRFTAALKEAHRRHAVGRPTDEVMRELRGDDPLL